MQLTFSKKRADSASGITDAPAAGQAVKHEGLVGLDVSAGGLAAARVVDGRVKTASIADIDSELMAEGEVADPAALGAALGEFFRANGLPKKVRMGVASQRVVIRMAELPLITDDKQLDAAVRFQAQEHIPMPLEEAVLDYEVVQNVIADDQQKLKVVLVAASRSLVEGLVGVAKHAGLKLQGIDLDAFALIRVLYPGAASDHETVAYVHYGDIVNVTLAEGRICTFTRATPKGFEDMVGGLSTRAKLTREHARLWAEHVGLTVPIEGVGGDHDIVRATRDELEVAAENLSNDVSAAINFYTVQEGTGRVSRILLAGPGAVVPGLADVLATRTGLPVETPGPLGAIDASDISGSGIDERRLTLAAGLALDEVAAQ